MRDILFKIVVAVEVIIILILGFSFFDEEVKVISSPIKEKNLISSLSSLNSDLNHFYEPKPGKKISQSPEWLPYTAEISINKDSLNERFNYSEEKGEGVFRIINLGDSWVYGMYVSTPDNFSERMEVVLNNSINLECEGIEEFQVINLGVPSYDVRYSLERFKVRGKKYNPDLVVMNLIPNDFNEITEFLKKKTSQYREAEEFKTSQNKAWNKKRAETRTSFMLWERAKGAQKRRYGKEGALNYQIKALSKLINYSDAPLILYNLEEVISLNSKQKETVRRLAKSEPSSYFYESNLKLEKGDGLLPDYHPSPKGHEMIAEDLINYMRKSKMIPCSYAK